MQEDLEPPSASSDPVVKAEANLEGDVSINDECQDSNDAASTGSEYHPDGSESDDSVAEQVQETNEEDLDKYYLVHGRMLMDLFRFCPRCGQPLKRVHLKPVGTAAVVRFACSICSTRWPSVKMWESQERVVNHSRERIHKGNVVSAVTTGLRFRESRYWSDGLSKAIWRYSPRPFSTKYLNGPSQQLKRCTAQSRRRYPRTVSENINARMEVEGMRRLLQWVVDNGFSVASVTTDRSRALRAALRDMEPELGAVRHYYDGWHLVKWLGNELRKASKFGDCGQIARWTQKLKSHLWTAIKLEAESGTTKAFFNTCLMHVCGVHQWPLEELTAPHTSCSHAPLSGPRPEGMCVDSKAYKKLREVVLTKSFQKDLEKVSPHEGTSRCEAKHALDRIYCPKEIFYPIETYPLYTMMATMHINALWRAEMNGTRKVVKVCLIKRKYLDRSSKLVLKSSPKQVWRDLVLDEVLRGRLIALQERGDSQWVEDLAEDYYEQEL